MDSVCTVGRGYSSRPLEQLPDQSSLHSGSRPGRDIEEGAVFDFAVLAEGLAKEDGRRGVSIGDLRDVHEQIIQPIINKVNAYPTMYMTTEN